MYWLPKLHKKAFGARFINASKCCSTKPLSDVNVKVFKMIFNNAQSFHEKGLFYSCFKKFCVAENAFPIITKLNQKHFNF